MSGAATRMATLVWSWPEVDDDCILLNFHDGYGCHTWGLKSPSKPTSTYIFISTCFIRWVSLWLFHMSENGTPRTTWRPCNWGFSFHSRPFHFLDYERGTSCMTNVAQEAIVNNAWAYAKVCSKDRSIWISDGIKAGAWCRNWARNVASERPRRWQPPYPGDSTTRSLGLVALP